MCPAQTSVFDKLALKGEGFCVSKALVLSPPSRFYLSFILAFCRSFVKRPETSERAFISHLVPPRGIAGNATCLSQFRRNNRDRWMPAKKRREFCFKRNCRVRRRLNRDKKRKKKKKIPCTFARSFVYLLFVHLPMRLSVSPALLFTSDVVRTKMVVAREIEPTAQQVQNSARFLPRVTTLFERRGLAPLQCWGGKKKKKKKKKSCALFPS